MLRHRVMWVVRSSLLLLSLLRRCCAVPDVVLDIVVRSYFYPHTSLRRQYQLLPLTTTTIPRRPLRLAAVEAAVTVVSGN